jgi:hypothetical protein
MIKILITGWALLCLSFPAAGATLLTGAQKTVLQEAITIGHKAGIGDQLAAVTYQESSLGLQPNSPGHYGVGSVGYLAWETVMARHPWLKAYFRGQNWATVLIKDPGISLWVSAYYIAYCRHQAANWWQAMSMYRYGSPHSSGPYPERINHRIAQIRKILTTTT